MRKQQINRRAFAMGFESSLGSSRYEFYADINFDLKIDMKDIAQAALRFGKEY